MPAEQTHKGRCNDLSMRPVRPGPGEALRSGVSTRFDGFRVHGQRGADPRPSLFFSVMPCYAVFLPPVCGAACDDSRPLYVSSFLSWLFNATGFKREQST